MTTTWKYEWQRHKWLQLKIKMQDVLGLMHMLQSARLCIGSPSFLADSGLAFSISGFFEMLENHSIPVKDVDLDEVEAEVVRL